MMNLGVIASSYIIYSSNMMQHGHNSLCSQHVGLLFDQPKL